MAIDDVIEIAIEKLPVINRPMPATRMTPMFAKRLTITEPTKIPDAETSSSSEYACAPEAES